MSFLDELKRRRVFRVTATYVVGAWIVLQVADTVFPALHFPPWTVTLVAVLAIIGFPIALLLGWVFDLTPDGIERTTGSFKFPVRAAIVATLLVALGVGGFVIVRRRAVAAGLDANAVVVLPFRVSGDSSLAHMREGMVDLIAVKLTGEGGPRALDSRTTLSAWSRKVGNARDDMPAADAVQLARSLRAGHVLLGEIVGTPGRVAVNATLYSSIDGRKLTTAEDAASPDSLLPLVDRIVAKLLSQQAGQGHRTEALLSQSLQAVRAYLDGQRYYRRGDYVTAGNYFRGALDQDSTFALAGLGLAAAAEWGAFDVDGRRGLDIAWTYRDRLPQPDREYLQALMGEKYPLPTPDKEYLRAWQDLVARAPDRLEAWYRIGDLTFHNGTAIDIANPYDKSLEAWNRALALDSTFMPALEHQVDVFAERGDTTNLRRIVDLVYGRVRPELKFKKSEAWIAALALRDAAWLARLRKNVDSIADGNILYAVRRIVMIGLPQEDVPLLIAASIRNALTPGQKVNAVITASHSLVNMGRLQDAEELLRAVESLAGPNLYNALRVSLANHYPDEADSKDLAPLAVTMLNDQNATPRDRCTAQRYLVSHGDVRSTSATISNLRAAAAANPQLLASTAGVCAAVLEAALKVHARTPDARAAVARVDSLLLHGAVDAGWRESFTLASTRFHSQLGDYEGALAVSQRGGSSSMVVSFAPLLLENARLAARLGKRDEAIRAYEHYLRIRPNPEPGVGAEITGQARSELAALVGETRR